MSFARRCTLTRSVLLLAIAAPTLALGATASAQASAAPLFGVTVDSIAQLKSTSSALGALPRRATTRVVFDVQQPAGYYAAAVAQIHKLSAVMGELLDSSDEKSISTGALRTRAQEYVATLGAGVDIWEVGNEVNGNWTGEYAVVEEKLTAAFEAARSAGGRAALTLYANNFGPDNCGDGSAELTPLQFSERYVPPRWPRASTTCCCPTTPRSAAGASRRRAKSRAR
jgi:hypothetical protein